MKGRIFLIAFLASVITYGQELEINYELMKEAGNFSNSGDGIGLFILAGNEWKSKSNPEIQSEFDNFMNGSGVKIRVYVQRVPSKDGSAYFPFALGKPIGSIVPWEEITSSLTKAVEFHKKNLETHLAELKNKDKKN